jgi:hypothetical protein
MLLASDANFSFLSPFANSFAATRTVRRKCLQSTSDDFTKIKIRSQSKDTEITYTVSKEDQGTINKALNTDYQTGQYQKEQREASNGAATDDRW